MTIRVELPYHLRTLAQVEGEVEIQIEGEGDGRPTLGDLLATLEARYPVLEGAIRHHGGGRRRDFIRFFACQEDLSHEPPDTPLPAEVVAGDEPFLVVGAMSGG